MRNELSHIEEIEKYLTDNMSVSERNRFETKMNSDTLLREDVEFQKQMIERIQFLAFKTAMLASHNSLVNLQKPWWKKGIYLNSLLALIGIALVVITISKIKNSEPIFENDIAPIDQKERADQKILNPVLEDKIEADQIPEMPSRNENRRKKTTQNFPHLAFQQTFQKADLDASLGGTIITKDSKSRIHFNPNSLVDKDGKIVQGNVEIRYREYRNSGEMAFSGIPMLYEEDGNEYRFNSAGMIEVRAYQNDQPLEIRTGGDFTIDYNVTQQVDSCYFFALNNEKQKWEKKQRIDFDSINRANSKDAEVRFDDEQKMGLKYRGMLQGRVDRFVLFETRENLPPIKISLYYPLEYRKDRWPAYQSTVENGFYEISEIDSGRYIAEIGCDGCDNLKIDEVVIYADKVSQLDATVSMLIGDDFSTRKYFGLFGRKRKKMMEKWKESSYTLSDSLIPITDWVVSERKKESDSISDLGKVIDDASITYAKSMLVSGLRCENFGVYNCDQIKLVKNQITIRPKFVDGKGIAILGIYILSMIDLNINAAFGFSPSNFKCESDGKTVVLAFTPDKLYAISANDFMALNITNGGNHTLKMEDITDRVKTSDDLKNYLGL